MTSLLLGLILIGSSLTYSEPEPPGHRMQPWSLEFVQEALPASVDFHPFPRYQDRDEWNEIAEDPRFAEGLKEIVERAREWKGQPITPVTASQYLDFQRTGQRTMYQNLLSQRERYLEAFALAECVEGKGEFLDPLMDALWAFCEESDWCLPAHTSGLIDMENPYIDLRASQMAAQLAQIDNVFGEALPPPVRKRIRYEMERRIFGPYLKRDDLGWLTSTHNWNSVCNGNILRAALFMIEDHERLARLVTKAQNAMCHYLKGFGLDGGTAEGMGYWNYGFSRYVFAGHLLNLYTQKRLNLMAPPIVKEIALFPARVELSPGKFPSFSDGGEQGSFLPGMMAYLAEDLDLPIVRHFAAYHMEKEFSVSGLDSVFLNRYMADLPAPSEEYQKDDYVYLRGVQWMISRAHPTDADGLAVAAKGGRNDEPHNHNDVGNFILHYKRESLIVDLGAPVYERDFFSSKRYNFLTARSLGHSVPRVNGMEQRPGGEARAIAKSTHTDGIDLLCSDITSAYPPEAGLEMLQRTVTLHREGKVGYVEVTDEAVLKEEGKTFETALMTFGKVTTPEAGVVRIEGDRGILFVKYSADEVQVSVQEFDMKEAKLRTADKFPTARRIAFEVKNPAKNVKVELRLEPVE